MAYNHFVPQFILKQYDKKLNVYSIKECKLDTNRTSKRIFGEEELYGQELEDMFTKMEGIFSNVYYNKILSDKIELTTKEILIVKKYLLISQIRVEMSIENDDRDEEEYIKKYNLNRFKEDKISKLKRAVKSIIECVSFEELLNNKNTTGATIKWATIYELCHLVFWDSKKVEEDFIISDTGMTCEHEYSKIVYNEELSKRFCFVKQFEKIKNFDFKNAKKYDKFQNNDLRTIQANFYVFNISKDRMIALVNPFYKHHPIYKNKLSYDFIDIFPTLMSHEAMAPNEFELTPKSKIENDIERKYNFEIKNLTLEEIVYINNLILDRVDNYLAFVDKDKIKRSVSTYAFLPIKNIDYDNQSNDLISDAIDNTNDINKKYSNLFDIYENLDEEYNTIFCKYKEDCNEQQKTAFAYATAFNNFLISSGDKKNFKK
ncbi:MAG: DUF4238 domain-containing protein [bacterium]